MKKNLFIHIGGPKTGTSAIQTFLASNRNVLENMKYCYPGTGKVHREIGKGLRNQVESDNSDVNNIIKKYLVEINTSHCENGIFSSEFFVLLNKKEIAALKNYTNRLFNVKIIIYFRRQDELLESWYNQVVKSAQRRETRNIDDYAVYLTQQKWFAYYEFLKPWRDEFGLKNIIVRVYEKEQLQNGIFENFLDAVQIKNSASFVFPEKEVNKSLNRTLIEIIRFCNINFKNDKELHNFLVKNLEKINQNDNDKKQFLLSPKERRHLIERYSESNEMVAREYLGREDGRLFYAPLPDPKEPWEPFEGLTVDTIVPIFLKIMDNMRCRKPQ